MAVWFLSHSSIDAEDARELKRRLEESPAAHAAGFRFWFDQTDLRPGPDLQAQLEQAIAETTDGFAVYIGSKGVINWVESELRLALARATAGDYPFIPILAKGATVAQLPPFATRYLAVFDPLNNPEQMAKLLAAVTGGAGEGKPLAMVVDPFVGLRAMTEKEADRFFGRKAELEGLIEQLRRNRLVAIVADSGSGKSSLVQAGLVPRFRGGVFGNDGRLEPEERIWHVIVMRPGASPTEGLRTALTTAAERLGLPAADKTRLRGAVDFTRAGDLAYVLQCGLPAETTETLLVVDQFEELFTQTPEEQRKPFVDWLLSLVAPGTPLRFRTVLTIRNDYFNLISAHPELFRRLREDSATLRLKQISEEGLAEIVNEPLKLAGHKDEAERTALVAQIRRDVSNRAGDLALVQMALYETWARRKDHGGDLLETYIAVGGVVGALANAAEEVRTTKLDDGERDRLESVLVRLVTLGDTGGATRRTASFEEFDAPRQALIRKLAADDYGRLLLTSDATVEICHEQLLTQWPWWQGRITRSAREVRRLGRMMEDARNWAESADSDKPKFLAAGADLDAFSDLYRTHPDWLSPDETAYVRISRDQADYETAQKRRAARRLRNFVRGLAALAVLLVVALGVAGWAFLQAQRAAEVAQREQARAIAESEKAEKAAADAAARLALAQVGIARERLEDGDTEGALVMMIHASSHFTDARPPEDLLINFDQALEAASDTEISPLFVDPQAFDLGDRLVLVDPATKDIHQLTDSLPARRIAAGKPEDAAIISVGQSPDRKSLVAIRADRSVESIAFADGARRTIGRFADLTPVIPEPGEPSYQITRDGLALRSDTGAEGGLQLQVLELDSGNLTTVAVPDVTEVRYAGKRGETRYLFAQFGKFVALTREGRGWRTAPVEPGDPLKYELVAEMCALGDAPDAPQLRQQIGRYVTDTFGLYVIELACRPIDDGMLVSLFSPSSSGEQREDMAFRGGGEPEDLRAVLASTLVSGLTVSDFTAVATEPGSGAIAALSNREALIVGVDPVNRFPHAGVPVALRFLSTNVLAVVEGDRGRIVAHHVGEGAFRPRTTTLAPDPDGIVGTQKPIRPFNRGTCVSTGGAPIATRFMISDGVEVRLTIGDREEGQQRINIRITGAGDPVSVTPFGDCVQFSRDWTRLLVLSETGIDIYDFDLIRSGKRLPEAKLSTIPGNRFQSAIFTGRPGDPIDIVTADASRLVQRWRWSGRAWGNRVVYRGQYEVLHAEPDEIGEHLVLIEQVRPGDLRRFLYTENARRTWRVLQQNYKRVGGAFDESLAIGSYDDGVGWEPMLRLPSLSELVGEAKATLPEACRPKIGEDYQTSACWPH